MVLLPFTLANVAGWMHPRLTGDPGRFRQVRDIRRLVTVLGYTLTATWALWLAIVLGDLLVYQGGRNLEPVEGAPFLAGLAVGAVLAAAGLLWRWVPLMAAGAAVAAAAVAARVVGSAHVRAVGGVVVAGATLGALALLAGLSRREYEARIPAGVTPAPARATASNEDLRSPTFFARPVASRRLLVGHIVLVAALTLLLGVRAFARAVDGHRSLDFGSTLLALNAVQLARSWPCWPCARWASGKA